MGLLLRAAEGLTGRASLTGRVLTGLEIRRRRRLRDEPPYTGRDGGAYGTSFLRDGTDVPAASSSFSMKYNGTERLTLFYGTVGLTGRISLRDGGTYGTNLLTEPLTGLFNYGAEELTG